MKNIVKRYSNGEITIIWKPDLCCHSTICYTGLPDVFVPSARPWVRPEKATTEQLIKQVKECPTAALSWEYDNKDKATKTEPDKVVVHLIKDGPIKVKAPCIVTDENGEEFEFTSSAAFCRCGKSKNHPFCDGTHKSE